jgi:hypothetical protein
LAAPAEAVQESDGAVFVIALAAVSATGASVEPEPVVEELDASVGDLRQRESCGCKHGSQVKRTRRRAADGAHEMFPP